MLNAKYPSIPNILITGATGYIGGRLLKLLSTSKVSLRCFVRHPEHLQVFESDTCTLVRGDVLNKNSLINAMQGITHAYYMVHSMGAAGKFVDMDKDAARNFGQAASECGVKRIIYVGGLGDDHVSHLSEHLQSRHDSVEKGDGIMEIGYGLCEGL